MSLSTQPPKKKRKLNRNLSARENADHLYNTDAYNVESWMQILNRADKECDLEEQRYVYKLFLTIFPSSSRQYKQCIELEMRHQHYDKASELFMQCVGCLDVELYKAYLVLANKINEKRPRDVKLKNMVEAYSFVIKLVGQDLSATSLWRQFLAFLKSNAKHLEAKHGVADATLEIRRSYQTAVKLPIHECDKLWEEYIAWETSKNATLAAAMSDKCKHQHELAKQVYLDRKRWKRGIFSHTHIVPSNNKHAQERNYQQIQLWKRFIDFELLNKQKLSAQALCRRMVFTFRQALMTTSLFPDIWIMFIEWTIAHRAKESVLSMFKQCLQRIPNCLLLQFQYLEYCEKINDIQTAEDHYLQILTTFPTSTLIYVRFLYFLRRCKSQAAARQFFIETIQKNSNQFWQLYVAVADIEENMNGDSSCALRIFGNGFKYFKENAQFVRCYVEYLMTKEKKDSDAKQTLRDIFSTILPHLDAQQKETAELWKLYLTFEQRQNSLSQVHAAEYARNQHLQCTRVDKLLHSIDRFTLLDLSPVSKQYRDTLIQTQQQTAHRKKTQQQLSTTSSTGSYLRGDRERVYGEHTMPPQRMNIVSRIKMNAFAQQNEKEADAMERSHYDGTGGEGSGAANSAPFVDMITFGREHIDAHASVAMPDPTQLCAFRPGIRFFQNLNEDDEDDEDMNGESNGDAGKDGENEEDEDVCMNKLKESLPQKLKELLNRLPPPQHTQLLKVEKHTAVIDIDSFVTMMKLKIGNGILTAPVIK